MQFHHGSKLKKIIENSGIPITKIIDTSQVSRATLYNFFGYQEIPVKKLTKVLNAINYDLDQFYSNKFEVKEEQAAYGLKAEVEALKKEIELLRQQIADKDEIISLLKLKRK